MRFPQFAGEWEGKKLGEIGHVKMCKRIFNEQTTPEGDIPFYKIGSFGRQADAYISRDLYLDYRNRFSFPKKGEILISAAGTIGRTVVYNGEDAYYQDSNIVWIENDNSKVSNEFLYYILQIVKYNTEGGTIQRLYNNILRTTRFNCPSFAEQTKIASFLSIVDERIAAQSKIIEGLKELKASLSKQIFSRKLRFNDENGNDFPEWEEKNLGKIGEIIGGGTPDTNIPEYWDGDINWFVPSEIGKQKYISSSVRTISYIGLKNSSAKLLSHGTILLSTRATIGEKSILNGEGCTNQGFQSISVNNENINIFIYYLLDKYKVDMIKNASGSTFLEISSSNLKKIKIIVPSFLEQQQIASALSAIDEKIETEKKVQKQFTEQKKFLLKQMFI